MTLGASRRQVATKVLLPAVIPELAAGLDVSIGLAWAITLGGEFLAVKDGIGRMILIAESFFQTGKMLILVAIIVVLAVLTTRLVNLVSAWMTRWVPRR
jgi:NitT/TauT family transport system permease protein